MSGSQPEGPLQVNDARGAPWVQATVVDRARRGDQDGLRELVQQAYPLVRRWIAAARAEPGEVDDVAQDVMVRVLSRLSSFRGESLFTTWLYRVTRNALLDGRKARERRRAGQEPLERAEHVPGAEVDPVEALGSERRMAHVRQAFQELSGRQREVFDLADIQGFTSPEIAGMLGMAPSTVRVTLLKARRALRSRLIELDPELAKEYGA